MTAAEFSGINPSLIGKHFRAIPAREPPREVNFDVSDLKPQITWGTNPGLVVDIDGLVPDPDMAPDSQTRASLQKALAYIFVAGPRATRA